MPQKIVWSRLVKAKVNDRQFFIWRRSLRMYKSLTVYRQVSTNYELIEWLHVCRTDRYLAVYIMLKLLSGISCLGVHKQHTPEGKVCRLCPSGQVEDLFHFTMVCNHFANIRNTMLMKIENTISAETKQILNDLTREIYFLILCGMNNPIPSCDLYSIRKIAVKCFQRMYKIRKDLEDNND